MSVYIVYYADDGPGKGMHTQDIKTTQPWHRLYAFDYEGFVEFRERVGTMESRKNARIVHIFRKIEFPE